MNLDDFSTEFENRRYINPDIALQEQNNFIENLRDVQLKKNSEINDQAYNLGMEVPSNLGGLTGADSYFSSRYQVPQTNAAVSNLRAAAQASALNQALQNEQDIWKKRYQDAYRNQQKRAWNKSTSSGSGSGTSGNTSTWNGDITTNANNHYVYWLGKDGNVWVTKNGTTSNLGAANIVNGQWDGKASGSAGSMEGDGTMINDPNPGGTPPNVEDYVVDIDSKYKNIPSGWRYIIEQINGRTKA